MGVCECVKISKLNSALLRTNNKTSVKMNYSITFIKKPREREQNRNKTNELFIPKCESLVRHMSRVRSYKTVSISMNIVLRRKMSLRTEREDNDDLLNDVKNDAV